ncbi:MAG TPA: hypothetical protein P5158_13595, partial [Chitinophagaceae bacterium]|nr:hypothetical protein [Chitinophagaceae bacterium]
MQFSDIIGQTTTRQHLTELVAHNRLSHALLFTGKEGNGALALAIAFAQYLVCEKTSNLNVQQGPSLFGDPEPQISNAELQTDSCGQCPSCQKVQQLIHPDIHFSYPTVTIKSGDKPIATDFISEWRDFIKTNPYGNLFDWIELIKEKENSQGKITAEECNDIIRKL